MSERGPDQPGNHGRNRMSLKCEHRSLWIKLVLLALSAAWLFSPVIVRALGGGLTSYLPVIPRNWPAPTPTPSPGRVLITEVLYDPSGDEPEGEWVEIANPGDLPFDLAGFKLGDEETSGELEGMFQFPPNARLEPGQVVLVAYRAVTFESVYHFLPDYEFSESDPFVPNLVKYASWSGGNVNLNNTGDEVLLLDSTDRRVDALSWGSSPLGFDPPVKRVADGASLERRPANVDTDSASDWIEQSSPNPGVIDVRQPTPTITITPTPTSTPSPTLTPTGISTATATASPTTTGTLVAGITPTRTATPSPTPTGTLVADVPVLISEVLYDPLGDDPGGEWIELYHHGDASVDLSGFRLGDEETYGGGEGMLVFPQGTTIQPGETLVVANRAALFQAVYAFAPHFEIIDSDPAVPEMEHDGLWASGSVNLSKDGDEVLLISPVGIWQDAVSWGSATTAFSPSVQPVLEGSSIERYPPGQDSDTAADWRAQPAPDPGAVDHTPPTSTPEATLPPFPREGFVINELHADPHAMEGDANGDGVVDVLQDEFVEIVNASGAAFDLSGWGLQDGYSLRHVFPDGSLLPDQCSAVVFGGGTPVGEFGGSLVQVASQGTLGLNNSGDTITLVDLTQTTVISYTYGSEGGDDQSLTRNPDITGPDPLVKHSTLPLSGGALYSPGVGLDGTFFGGCGSQPAGLLHQDGVFAWLARLVFFPDDD